MDDQGEPIVEHYFLVRDIDVLGLRQCAETDDGRNQQETKRAHELLLSKNVGRRTETLVRAYPESGGNRVRRNSVGVYMVGTAGIMLSFSCRVMEKPSSFARPDAQGLLAPHTDREI